MWALLMGWADCKQRGFFDLWNEATVEIALKFKLAFEKEAAFPFIR
jgi:hypothetical protein